MFSRTPTLNNGQPLYKGQNGLVPMCPLDVPLYHVCMVIIPRTSYWLFENRWQNFTIFSSIVHSYHGVNYLSVSMRANYTKKNCSSHKVLNSSAGIQCGSLEAPTGFNISYSQPGCTYEGCTATYICEGEDEGEGNRVMRTCSSSGQWTGDAPTTSCAQGSYVLTS